jgi:hypothetical protein
MDGKTRHPDLSSGVFWLIFGIVLSIWSARYQIRKLSQPGPGLLPLAMGLLIIFLSLLLLARGLSLPSALRHDDIGQKSGDLREKNQQNKSHGKGDEKGHNPFKNRLKRNILGHGFGYINV